MSTQKIGFYEDLTKKFFQLSSDFIKYTPLTKMKRFLQGCSSVAATMQQSKMYATTGGDRVVN